MTWRVRVTGLLAVSAMLAAMSVASGAFWIEIWSWLGW
jgi:hypothetical protein